MYCTLSLSILSKILKASSNLVSFFAFSTSCTAFLSLGMKLFDSYISFRNSRYFSTISLLWSWRFLWEKWLLSIFGESKRSPTLKCRYIPLWSDAKCWWKWWWPALVAISASSGVMKMWSILFEPWRKVLSFLRAGLRVATASIRLLWVVKNEEDYLEPVPCSNPS